MTLKDRLLEAQNKIARALSQSERKQEVEIVAATKTQEPKLVEETIACGVKSIGENRIQEAEKKFQKTTLNINTKKRFIGHLQSNKVNKCVDLFDTIDSIHSVKIAKRISTRLIEVNKKIECLVEVNTSGDQTKHGFLPNEIKEILDCVSIENLNIRGLMTLGPKSQDPQKTRESFSLLRNTMIKINSTMNNKKLKELSMGMSGDYTIGVEEGSTMVRLGTLLYGPRNTQ